MSIHSIQLSMTFVNEFHPSPRNFSAISSFTYFNICMNKLFSYFYVANLMMQGINAGDCTEILDIYNIILN